MEKKNNIWGKWLYWFIFAVAVITVYKTLDNFTQIANWIKGIINVLMPFIIGILIAYIFYIPSKKIERFYSKSKLKLIKKKARTLSVFTVYLIALILIILAMNFIIPTLVTSFQDLANNLVGYYNNTIEGLKNIPEDSILRKIDIEKIASSLSNIKLEEYINLNTITEYAKGAIGIANGIFDFFVSLIVSVYILLERTRILNFIKKLAGAILKEKTYNAIGKYFNNTNTIFFKFLSSQILDAFIVGVLTRSCNANFRSEICSITRFPNRHIKPNPLLWSNSWGWNKHYNNNIHRRNIKSNMACSSSYNTSTN